MDVYAVEKSRLPPDKAFWIFRPSILAERGIEGCLQKTPSEANQVGQATKAEMQKFLLQMSIFLGKIVCLRAKIWRV
jgi:hypothetical protein